MDCSACVRAGAGEAALTTCWGRPAGLDDVDHPVARPNPRRAVASGRGGCRGVRISRVQRGSGSRGRAARTSRAGRRCPCRVGATPSDFTSTLACRHRPRHRPTASPSSRHAARGHMDDRPRLRSSSNARLQKAQRDDVRLPGQQVVADVEAAHGRQVAVDHSGGQLLDEPRGLAVAASISGASGAAPRPARVGFVAPAHLT